MAVWTVDYQMEAVEFGLDATFEILDIIARPGFVNSGTLQSPIFESTSGCPPLGHVVAELTIRDSTGDGGRVCLVDSPVNGRLCCRFCGGAEFIRVLHRGFSTDGLGYCEGGSTSSGCSSVVSVTQGTWGRVKVMYR